MYRGAHDALIGGSGRESNSDSPHGKDGMGDVPDTDAVTIDMIQSEHAAVALIKTSDKHAGQ